MSLTERWQDFEIVNLDRIRQKANISSFWKARLKEAFYAGAKAGIEEERQARARIEVAEAARHKNPISEQDISCSNSGISRYLGSR